MIYVKLIHNLQSSSLVMDVEIDRCINRISMGETNTAYGILVLVGARTSDGTNEKRNVPCVGGCQNQ